MRKIKTIQDYEFGPNLTVDHMILYQIISDEKFWSSVPAFSFLKTSSQEVVRRIVAGIVDSKTVTSCAGCSNVRPLLLPLLITFGQHLAQLREDSPKSIAELVLYLSERRGYRPRQITVYYKDSKGENRRVDV